MITTAGQMHIKRYLAGMFSDIGRSIAFGIGSKPEALSDVQLQFEIARVPVEILSYDYVNDRLIFKGSVENSFAGSISEVGLYSREASIAGANGSRIIASFDSATEVWWDQSSNAATYTTDGALIGTDSAVVSLGAGQNATLTMNDTALNLSEYSGGDKLSFAFQSSANVANIQFRFMTDAQNYYTFTIAGGNITTGLNIISVDKSTAVPTGTPDWSLISVLSVVTTSAASGSATVKFEGIRIEDTDTIDEGYILVSRVVLPEPFVKLAGSRQDVEFPMEVNLG